MAIDFSDAAYRKSLAAELVDHIDSYIASSSEARARWTEVQGVYDDDPESVVSSFTWPKYVQRPYNVAMLQTRADALVSDVVGGLTEASPMFINRGSGADVPVMTPEGVPAQLPTGGYTETAMGPVLETEPVYMSAETVRENTEKTVEYALRVAGIERKARDAGYEAVKKGRGLLRLRYITAEKQDADENFDTPIISAYSPVAYSGLKIDSYELEDAVFYPYSSENAEDCVTVGARFLQTVQSIKRKIATGDYFKDAKVSETGDAQGSVENNPLHSNKKCYELYTRIQDGNKYATAWYRVVLAYEDQEILSAELWDHPRIPLFSPAMKIEPNRIIPKRSIAAKALEMQALMNDLVTAAVVGTVNSAFTNAVVTGMLQTEGNIELGLNEMLPLESPTGQVTPLQSQFQAGAIPFLMQFTERIVDGVFRITPMGQGQQAQSDRTATEIQGQLAGQDRGLAEYRATFGEELEKMAEYAKWLLLQNYEDFKAFHGNNAACTSEMELAAPSRFEVFGRSPSASPDAMLGKLNALIGMTAQLRVPIDPMKVFEIAVNMLNLPVNASKLLADASNANAGLNPDVQQQGMGAPMPPAASA